MCFSEKGKLQKYVCRDIIYIKWKNKLTLYIAREYTISKNINNIDMTFNCKTGGYL